MVLIGNLVFLSLIVIPIGVTLLLVVWPPVYIKFGVGAVLYVSLLSIPALALGATTHYAGCWILLRRTGISSARTASMVASPLLLVWWLFPAHWEEGTLPNARATVALILAASVVVLLYVGLCRIPEPPSDPGGGDGT